MTSSNGARNSTLKREIKKKYQKHRVIANHPPGTADLTDHAAIAGHTDDYAKRLAGPRNEKPSP